MKTVSQMIRRYMSAAFGVVLLIFTVNIALYVGIVIYYGVQKQSNGSYKVGTFAESFVRTEDGRYEPGGEYTLNEWMEGREWAMLLDQTGDILWSERLPEQLNRHYTVPEVAAFSRWYLDDYPVMVYRNDYGLLVVGLPRDSITRFDFWMDTDIIKTMLSGFMPLLVLDGVIILLLCLWLGWRGARPLLEVGKGIDTLATGQPVHLKERGLSAELAGKLNQTSDYLQRQAALIERRDNARTNWISGVSHDIRTPLALILGYAEQLEHADVLNEEQRQKAAGIRVQSQKIKALIEDLNLTSKLQYNAQPLRLEERAVGPLLRQCVAEFCNGGQAEQCEVDFCLSDAANQMRLPLDAALFSRAIENLLNNSARHNPKGCAILVRGEEKEGRLCLTVTDNGKGYPSPVLAVLECPEEGERPNAPHILGLHLVRQIVEAHGGTVRFWNADGAAAEIVLGGGTKKKGE